MASWTSLLQRPPQQNPYQAEAAGQQQALTAQAMMQQADARKQQAQLADQQIQENALKNQAEQQAIKDQQSFRDAYTAANGNLSKFKQIAPQYGVNPQHTAALEAETLKAQEAYAKLDKDQRDATTAKAKTLGTTAYQLLQLPPEVRAAKLPQAIQALVQSGDITKEQGQQYIANPPDENDLRLLAAHANTVAGIAEEVHRQENKPLLQAQTQEAQEKALLAQRQAVAPILENAASEGKEAYQKAFSQVKPEVQKYFTHPDQYDEDTTPEDARSGGLTPEQKAVRQQAKDNAQATADYRDLSHDDRLKRINLEEQRLNGERDQTKNSEAIDRRRAESEALQLEVEEAKLNRERRKLGEQLVVSGSTGKDAKGNAVDKDSIQGQLEDATLALKRVVANKYDAYSRAGRGAPKVALEDALGAIDKGVSAQAVAPAAKPGTPAPAANTATPVASKFTIGQVVKRKDGKMFKITAIGKDGAIQGEEVKK